MDELHRLQGKGLDFPDRLQPQIPVIVEPKIIADMVQQAIGLAPANLEGQSAPRVDKPVDTVPDLALHVRSELNHDSLLPLVRLDPAVTAAPIALCLS